MPSLQLQHESSSVLLAGMENGCRGRLLTFGLLPAALSRGIGSDSQRPFAIVIVGGLLAALLLSIFVLPTLYVWIARDGDKLPELEQSLEENA